ncbi:MULTISPECIES: fumarylacetoacetate hydrolase family protein [unclassified Leucobacter]|uniref:fumarylacetoacetate hydrolase family protein n=1 Tax=unclassified Leucobacter TaxID=2621730 RepID=UPI00165DB8D9|nr:MULTISPECIES: fumarylacetoacetate hydrolase family protein [unclassified Leucobacter]MBC9936493.1 fumarylacetoacetate hydrolase family protein [Leucobacter sp. cx-87]
MRLATLRTNTGTTAARREGDQYIPIAGAADVGALLQDPAWRERAAAATAEEAGAIAVEAAELDPVIPHPGKILCAGLNYASHIREMGRELPEHPTLFAKFAQTLTGPFDDVAIPPEDDAIDWEAELAIVIGIGGRRIPESEAAAHIAGFTVANDVSMRTWQFRTVEWLQGKIWDRSTPLGPELVTTDEVAPDARIRTVLDGEVMQDGQIGDLVHGPEFLVSYVSTILELHPGDVLLTGTTGGVGRARTPEVYLRQGQLLETEIDGIGVLRNRIVAESAAVGAGTATVSAPEAG